MKIDKIEWYIVVDIYSIDHIQAIFKTSNIQYDLHKQKLKYHHISIYSMAFYLPSEIKPSTLFGTEHANIAR